MQIVSSIILGLIQGITEFLPISSSGHLIIVRDLLNVPLENTLHIDALLHVATLFAIITCFWGDIRRIIVDFSSQGFSHRSSKIVWAIIVGSIPAGLVGFYGGDIIESTFRNTSQVAYALIAGSVIFLLADNISSIASKISKSGSISIIKGFFVGIFQSLALIPGVSRSGITISGGLFVGLSREESIRFAFLLGIPTILGAFLKTTIDLDLSGDLITTYFFSLESLLGFLAAFGSGLWAIRFLVRYLSTHSFKVFIIYRLILAAIILLLV